MQDVTPIHRSRLSVSAPHLVLGFAAAALVWSYWSALAALVHRWNIDPQYSHGFVVPLIAAGIIWHRRERLKWEEAAPSWAGLVLIGIAVAMRLVSARYYLEALDWISLVPSVAGICLLAGGRAAWRCAWPGILFLVFMLPLPYRVETLLSGPLQSLATAASTFSLQTLGFPAIAEGNLIHIDETTVGVAEACSGLRMLVVFFAVSTATAIVVDRTLWERMLIIASAVPVAMASNVVRITLTGVLFETVGSAWARLVFHDFAGWLMMLLAIGLLNLELWLLDRILIPPPPREVVPVFNQAAVVPVRSDPGMSRCAAPEPAETEREQTAATV